ncbi:hypothetical protein MRB53_016595 [Persea americana]|uniref:Uncharacterized protein n=1 Tax=Persea americana TaxID=3435 RepID=A0ACC2M2R2_PERAE|nr:hypothetical protein MRB53_016595 [Persea americana]
MGNDRVRTVLPPLLQSSSMPQNLPGLKSAPSSLPLHLLYHSLDPPNLRSSQTDVEESAHLDAEDPARTQCLRILPGIQPFCPQMNTKDPALQLRL